MKKILIALAAALALTLTGCAEDNEKPIIDESTTSSTPTATDNGNTSITVPSSSVTVVATPTTSTPVESNTVESNPVGGNPTESKPVESTPTTSTATKPVESKPVESKPVEVHTHTFTEATCEKPATCNCGETKGNALGHKYNEGVCIRCGKKDPNYVAVHNCKKDGHIWGNSYTKEYTEDFELKESHNVYACGFDKTLAKRYGCTTNVDFDALFDMVYGSGSTNVKTTATRTVTEYYHKCSECGATEKYDTDEDVTASENWVVVNSKSTQSMCQTIWWDINDIPSEVWDWVEADKQAKEDFFNSL